MRFYNQPHRFCCGVDLHARTLSLCILDASGTILRHDACEADPEPGTNWAEPSGPSPPFRKAGAGVRKSFWGVRREPAVAWPARAGPKTTGEVFGAASWLTRRAERRASSQERSDPVGSAYHVA